MIVKIALYGIRFIFLMIFAYFLIKLLMDLKKRDFISNFFDSFSKKYEIRRIQEEAKFLYEGATKDKKLIEKLDGLLQKSRIRSVFRFLTSEILIMATIALATVVSIIIYLFSNSMILSIAAFIFIGFAVILIFKSMANISFNKIDKQQLSYTNILKNLSVSNNDIVSIFEKSIPYADEPIKGYVEQFVFECKKGISLEKAFKNLEDKIENGRFKQLLKNLLIASKHDGNYGKVLNESRIIFKHYYAEKERRKKEVNSGRLGITLIVVIGIVVFKLLESFTGNIFVMLNQTSVGNVLLVYFLIVFIYAIYKFVNLDRLNY